MHELVLHHYWESPYAEKIRRILGWKGLAWRSVVIPIVMPKPGLTALTGGYRKTPVMQLGADIYCDTDLIARVIERLHPVPSLYPDASASLAQMLGPWQQEVFGLAVRLIGISAPVFPPGFLEDRSKMFDGGLSIEAVLRDIPAQREQLRAKLVLLDRHLRDRGPFILGSQASLADFSLFHPVFALDTTPQTRVILEPFTSVRGWIDRIARFGHGTCTEMDAEEAITLARDATSTTQPVADPEEPNGLVPGDRVVVVHESFGRDPVRGELVASAADEIAIARRDERAGDVVVHFPREHYLVRREERAHA